MKRSRGIGGLVTLGLVVGGVATASAVVLITVLQLLTLFSIVGLTFNTYADVHAVPDAPGEAAACDIVIEILDEHGQVLDTRQARVPSGEMASLQYRSRRGPGETDTIRASVKSRTAPRPPLPPGPCPVLASLQVIDASSGKTEAMMLPAVQRVVRVVISAP